MKSSLQDHDIRICNVGKSFAIERDIRTFKEQNVDIYT